MKFPRKYSLQEIADLIGAKFAGHPEHEVLGINEIHKVVPGDIVFVDHPKYYDKALKSAATTVIINKEVDVPEGKGLLFSDDPFRDFNWLTRHFNPYAHLPAHLGESSKIGQGTFIHPTAVVGENVVIGENCVIAAGVVIYHDTIIGDRVKIHANAVIGADAFYYKKRPETGYDKMHTCGSVEIGNDVEIGALCTIDRGVTGATVLGAGSKLDNHVHVGHDTVIGQRCLFAAQVGIAGCVVIEDDVILWGQVGVPSDLRIGKGAVVLGQSGVMGSLEGGKTYFGSPAGEAKAKFRELAHIRKLAEVFEKLG
jgi:UDP-3-O-[3-hydroxymyristoyl] glucosamine N-acyltransferase